MNAVKLTMVVKALVLTCSLCAANSFAVVVINANCETNLNSWGPRDGIPSGVPPIVLTPTLINTDHRPSSLGIQCFQISGRDHVQDCLKQSVLPGLLANGNGRTYTTRVWIKIAPTGADASVRCLLRWADSGVSQRPIILAETVVTNSGSWIEIAGTAKLQWITSLTGATFEFEVEQIHKGNAAPLAPTWFPTFLVDDITMDIDADGDGLLDSEESADHGQSTLSFLDSADSDADRMPDDWERTNLLDARNFADAAADSDNDGFSNAQEYFAATNPWLVTSYPGKPSDELATPLTRALLRYLALRPHDQQSLVGQMVSDNSTGYATFITALAAQPGGKYVAILGLAVEALQSPIDIHASIDNAITFANGGGIVQVKWAMWNPWRAHLYNPATPWIGVGVPGDLNKVDIFGMLDPAGTPTVSTNSAAENIAARVEMDGWIDTIAVEFARWNVATGNQPILFRPISEMNGDWFWWGHRTRDEYLVLWNHIRDRLMTTHGLHNIVWTYESASGVHTHSGPSTTATASDYYYPGDDAVDIFSHNLYDGDWILPFDANKIYARHPKIYAVPQAGPDKVWPNRTGVFDNRIYANQIAERYPRNSLFICWDSFSNNQDDDNDPNTPSSNDDPDPTTPDDPYQHLAIIDNQFAGALLADPRITTRDELAWRPATADFDANGNVDGADLVMLLSGWGSVNPPIGDLDNDGVITGVDLAIFLSQWTP